jgi:hypothetical protein
LGKSAPKAPDPVKVSAAEAKASKDVAQFNQSLNSMNQYSPFGSMEYTSAGIDPVTGAQRMNQTTSLSPELQSLFDSQIGSQRGISDAITGAIGRLPTGEFNPNIDVGDVRQRSFDSQMALLNPQFEQGFKELEGRMSDRGLPVGSEVWNDQFGEYNRAKDTSMLGAARQADLDASNEFQRQYGNELTEYNLPLQQLGALMGNSQAVGNPQFGNYAQASAQAPDVGGNTWKAYQANMDRYNQQQAGIGSLVGGVTSMLPLLLSDERTKENVEPVDGEEILEGLGRIPIGSWNYKPEAQDQFGVPGDPMVGPMAQGVAGEFGGSPNVIDLGDMMGKVLAGLKALDQRTQPLKSQAYR